MVGKDLDPAGADAVVPIEMVVADDVETDDFGTPPATNEAQEQNCPVAQPPQFDLQAIRQ